MKDSMKDMMKLHFILPLTVAILALAFLDPFDFLMPGMMAELVLGLLVLATVGYGTLIYKERPQDERDVHIRAYAHRLSYVVSIAGLVAIIGYYLLSKGHVYPEIIYLLVIVVATKTLSHWYGDRNF